MAYEWPLVPRRFGKTVFRRGFSVVRQAQMIARLTSTAPQYARIAKSYVMSMLKSSLLREMMRMMDTRQTL